MSYELIAGAMLNAARYAQAWNDIVKTITVQEHEFLKQHEALHRYLAR